MKNKVGGPDSNDYRDGRYWDDRMIACMAFDAPLTALCFVGIVVAAVLILIFG